MTKIFTKEENQAWSKTLSGKMCSACIALRSSNQVLMVKACYKEHWTFPSGIVDLNESPKAAAIRETTEEVGVKINENQCTLLRLIYTASSGGDRDRFNFAFIADIPDKKTEFTVPNSEIEKAEWVNFDNITERSGNKGSYKKIQEALLNPDINEPYTEVYPDSLIH